MEEKTRSQLWEDMQKRLDATTMVLTQLLSRAATTNSFEEAAAIAREIIRATELHAKLRALIPVN